MELCKEIQAQSKAVEDVAKTGGSPVRWADEPLRALDDVGALLWQTYAKVPKRER